MAVVKFVRKAAPATGAGVVVQNVSAGVVEADEAAAESVETVETEVTEPEQPATQPTVRRRVSVKAARLAGGDTMTGAAAPAPKTEVAAPVEQPPVASVPVTRAVVPAPASAPAPAETGGFFDDDRIEPGDLVLPRLSIVQKVGDLSTQFTPGTIVLDGAVVLADAPKKDEMSAPVRLVVLGFQPTVFVEKVQGGGRGLMLNTEAEVRQAGGTVDWNEAQTTGKPLFQRLATALVLIERPAKAPVELFGHTIEDKDYALALYSMKGTSYTHAARHFKSARRIGHLRSGYRYGYWQFRSQLRKYDSNYAYVPVVRPDGATTEGFRDAVKALLGF